jgi:hypothetical protein
MTTHQAEKFIDFLCQKWGIKDKDFLMETVKYLNQAINKKYSFSDYFEFSLIEGEPKIRLLHLDFCQSNLPIGIIKKNLKKRETAIVFIFRKLNQKFNCHYNLSLLQSFFQFNQESGLWPIQFGLEYQKNSQPKIKVYLSLEEKYSKRKERFSLSKFCQKFNLDDRVLSKRLKNRRFDTVAIDFLPAKGYCFKFYPFFRNKGFLYRVRPFSEIDSQKKWQRFPQGIVAEKIIDKLKMNTQIKKTIKENKFKIYYLCSEDRKKSIYFR